MEQVGYSLVQVSDGAEVMCWGDQLGRCASIPNVLPLPNGDRVEAPVVGETYQGYKLVPRWSELASVAATGFDGTNFVVMRAITSDHVNAERDRRLQTIRFNGVLYDFLDNKGSADNIAGASTLALAAIVSGAQAGNLRWANPDVDFVWIAHDNSFTPMDAQTVISFGQAAAAWKAAHIYAARSIKDMTPIPDAFATDAYWPSA